MKASFRIFQSTFSSWDTLFGEASKFATELGPKRLINISHSGDQSRGVVTVWYWSDDVTDKVNPPSRISTLKR